MIDDTKPTAGVSETRRRLTLHPPNDGHVADQMGLVREAIIALGETLENELPTSRELSLALTKLEECCYWAIGAIARHQDDTNQEDRTDG